MTQPNPHIAKMIMTGRASGWGGFHWEQQGAGSISPKEGLLLYETVLKVRPAAILEIGTGEGFSTLYLAQACKDAGAGHVYTVEINPGHADTGRRNIEAAGLWEYVTQLTEMPFVKPDMALLDAGHTSEAVREYLAYVETCPLVFIHDATWKDHVLEATKGLGWQVEIIPDLSFAGLARLTREAVTA